MSDRARPRARRLGRPPHRPRTDLRPDTLAVRGGLVRSAVPARRPRRCSSRRATSTPPPPRPRPRSPATSTGSCTRATATRRCPRSRSACACSRAPRPRTPPRRACPRCSPRSPRSCSPGSRIVAARALFGSTVVIFDEILAKWGVRTDYVDGHVLDAVGGRAVDAGRRRVLRDAVQPDAGPRRHRGGQPARARRRRHGHRRQRVRHARAVPAARASAPTSSCTPRPSTSTARAGCSAARSSAPTSTSTARCRPSSATPARRCRAFNAWVLLKGLETLSLRVRHQTASALQRRDVARAAARRLAASATRTCRRTRSTSSRSRSSPAAAPSSRSTSPCPRAPTPDVAKKVTFGVLDALRVVDISNNLGDAKSIVTHPATTTHRKLGPEGRAAVGIAESTVRLSVGLEDPADLIDDLAQALGDASPADACATLAACAQLVVARPPARRGCSPASLVGARRSAGRRRSRRCWPGGRPWPRCSSSWTWAVVAPMDPDDTASHATREEPTRFGAHAVVVAAARRDARRGRRRARRQGDRPRCCRRSPCWPACWRRGPRSTPCSRCGTRGCT